jgi:multiple sugar transport system ATP-binding protein
MARVLFKNVTKKYGNSLVVDNFNLLVRDGEFLVLVGPSGCGKTTVLRMVAGLESVTSGEIYIGERLVNDLAPRDRNVAMVFESPSFGLYPHMTSYENMAFGLRMRSKKKPSPGAASEEAGEAATDKPHTPEVATDRSHKESAIRERVDAVAGRLQLSQYLNRKQRQLSSGLSQSLALGRSLVQQPDLFLMDDPLSQIDVHNREANRMEIRRQHRAQSATTIFVTHDQQDAMALGDRIAVMNEGTLQQVGTPQALYAHPANAFVALFIGSPPMNLLPATIEIEGEAMFLQGDGFRVHVPEELAQRLSESVGNSIMLGLRPEAIRDPRRATNPNPQMLVSGKVTAREYTGQDIFLHLLVGSQELVARMDERTNAWPPDNFTVAFDMEQMHAFDPKTEQALL